VRRDLNRGEAVDTFQSIDAFVRVAEASSFADVARQLGVAIRVFLAPNHAPCLRGSS